MDGPATLSQVVRVCVRTALTLTLSLRRFRRLLKISRRIDDGMVMIVSGRKPGARSGTHDGPAAFAAPGLTPRRLAGMYELASSSYRGASAIDLAAFIGIELAKHNV